MPAFACAAIQLSAAACGLLFLPSSAPNKQHNSPKPQYQPRHAPGSLSSQVYEPTHMAPSEHMVSDEVKEILRRSYHHDPMELNEAVDGESIELIRRDETAPSILNSDFFNPITSSQPNQEPSYQAIPSNDLSTKTSSYQHSYDVESAMPRTEIDEETKEHDTTPLLYMGVFAFAAVMNALSSSIDEMANVTEALLLPWPVNNGGVGLSAEQSGLLFGCGGAGMFVLILTLLPTLEKLLGPIQLYRLSSVCLAVVFASMAITCAFVFETAGVSEHTRWWVLMFQVAFANAFSASALVCANIFVQHAIQEVAPHRLGEGNGLSQTLITTGRIVGPSVAGLLFSVGEGMGFVALVAVGVCVLSFGAAVSTYIRVPLIREAEIGEVETPSSVVVEYHSIPVEKPQACRIRI